MAAARVFFVSKWLRRPAAILVCFALTQLLLVLANCEGEHAPMAARTGAAVQHGR